MHLDPEELLLFFRLFPSLLCFVNKRHKVSTTPFKLPGDLVKLSLEEQLELRDTLVAHQEDIDAFVTENPFKLPEDELEVVRAWKDMVAGEFYVFRHLQKHSVFLTAGDPALAYGVVSLAQPLEDLIGPGLPYLCKTILLPFRGRIVYDGLLAGYKLTFGPGVRRSLKESYDAAKALYGIITTLPPSPPDAARVQTKTKAKQPPAHAKSATRKAAPANAAPASQAHDEIVALTNAFCQNYLDDEYAALCRKLAYLLARKRPSPLTSGKPESWASGIIRVIGMNNFLNDPSQPNSMTMTEIDDRIGVSPATGAAKAAAIRKLVKIRRFDVEWTLPSRMDQNPLVWMIEVNGLIADARYLPREIQEEALRKGLIPYIPDARPGDQAKK